METVQTSAPDLNAVQVPAEFLEKIPLRFAREHAVVAIEKRSQGENVQYELACAHPDRFWVIDRIAYRLDAEVEVAPAPEEEILKLIARSYHADSQGVAAVADEIAAQIEAGGEIQLGEDVLELDDKAPAVKLVHAMLLQAVKQRASDIHVEPGEGALRVRFRIDGVLYDRVSLRPEVREGVTSRIKVMGRMDIAERRLPQDGGVTIRIGERRIDLRISTIPTQFGERVVLRLLDKHTGLLSLERLGLSPVNQAAIRKLLGYSHGIVLLSGPTGSGKTTTLYAMLSSLNSAELNILTLEDPIEYQLAGISQTQVSEKKGLNFAKGLRALVRQDPDIIMVGEIRDLETAGIAIQSALTGHLVLSTLHTNDSASSVTRLLDLGVEPYLVASSLNATISQRLVRQVCTACAERIPIDADALRCDGLREEEVDFLAKLGTKSIPRSRGCEACFRTGFFNRTGIYEMLVINDALRELVNARAPSGRIKSAALDQGLVTLRRDGLRKVADGLTTLEEVRDVTQMDLE